MSELPEALNLVAARQRGVVSRRQALAHLSRDAVRWRLSSQRWRRLLPGVYAVHRGPVGWDMRASAALIYAGPGAALANETAGHLYGLVRRPPQVLSIAVPHARRVRPVPGLRIVRHRSVDVRQQRGLAVTGAETTVLDCCASPLLSDQQATALVADAVRTGVTTPERLIDALAARSRHPRRHVMRLALGDVQLGAESLLEMMAMRTVITAHRLPTMTLQSQDHGHRLRRDFESVEFGVILEVDGRVGHEGSGRIEDLRRDRAASSSGKVTLRAGWVDVHSSPCELAIDLYGTYVARGYQGAITPCRPTCPAHRAGRRPGRLDGALTPSGFPSARPMG